MIRLQGGRGKRSEPEAPAFQDKDIQRTFDLDGQRGSVPLAIEEALVKHGKIHRP